MIAFVVVQLMQTNTDLPTVPQGDILGRFAAVADRSRRARPRRLALLPTSPPNLQPDFTGQGVLVTIKLNERTWLRITADGIDQYVGIATPGTTLEYPAGEQRHRHRQQRAGAQRRLQRAAAADVWRARAVGRQSSSARPASQINSGPGYAPTPINSPTPLPTPTDAAGALVAQLTPTDTPGPSPTPSDTLTPVARRRARRRSRPTRRSPTETLHAQSDTPTR